MSLLSGYPQRVTGANFARISICSAKTRIYHLLRLITLLVYSVCYNIAIMKRLERIPVNDPERCMSATIQQALAVRAMLE